MNDERTYPSDPPRTVISYNLLTNYIREQRTLSRANINDPQYQQNIDRAVAHFTEVLTFTIVTNPRQSNQDLNPRQNNQDLQATPTIPNNAIPSSQSSPNKIYQFIQSLCRIDISNLSEDNKDCEICFERLGEWRWGTEHPINAGALEPFQVLEDMMPEDPVKLPCGHYFGELCLLNWIKETSEGPPTCPKCRSNLWGVGEVNGPNT